MAYEIEKGVPLPKKKVSCGCPRLYPFEDMKIGDSFVARDKTIENVRTLCSSWGRRLKRKFFASEEEKGVIRVWRVKKL